MSLHCAYTCCNLDALLTKNCQHMCLWRLPHVLPLVVRMDQRVGSASWVPAGHRRLHCHKTSRALCLLRALQQQDMQQQQDMKMAKSAQPPWNTSSKLLVGCPFHCPCHYTTHTWKGLTKAAIQRVSAAQIKNLTCYCMADCMTKKCSHIQAYASTKLNKAMPPSCPLAAAAHMCARCPVAHNTPASSPGQVGWFLPQGADSGTTPCLADATCTCCFTGPISVLMLSCRACP